MQRSCNAWQTACLKHQQSSWKRVSPGPVKGDVLIVASQHQLKYRCGGEGGGGGTTIKLATRLSI